MDHDHDGILDLVSGSYQPGSIYLFRGLGKGKFAPPQEILDRNNKPVNPGSAPDVDPKTRNFRRKSATDPCFADWDNDGDLDILIGSMEGEIVLVVNEGTRARPVYASRARLLHHNGRPIRVPWGEGAPEVADWDGDGLVDLLSGSGSGAVFFFRNVGKRGAPRYAEGEMIIPAGNKKAVVLGSDAVPTPGHTSRLHATDLDGDGRLDLLLGDYLEISRLRADLDVDEQKTCAALRRELLLEIATEKKLVQTREEKMYRLGYRPAGIFAPSVKLLLPVWDRIEKLKKKLQAYTGKQTRHGFVWVFVRKDPRQ